MPRGSKSNQPTAKSEQARALWGTFGSTQAPTVVDWDPKVEPLVAAILEVVSSGATLVFRPGSGGRAIGVAIWEGDIRHAPKWVYDAEELDEWAAWVNERAAGENRAAD